MRITEIVTASPYNAGFAAAATLGIVLAIRSGRDRQFAPAAWYAILASALAAGIIGSKLIFLDFEPIAPGEKTVLGGLILGILTALAVATTVRINAWRALDAMTVPTLAAMAVGRIGCFLAGCCAGTHSDLPWAVTSPRHGADVHPVQLYEAAADVLLIFALRRGGASKRDGQHFLLATLGYIGIRIATEFVRDGRSLYGPLNLVQWSLLAIGIVLTWVAIRRAQAVGDAVQLPPVANHPTPAVGAAVGIAITVWLAGTWFVPLEQMVLLGLAAALAMVAGVSLLPRRAWRLAPLAPLAIMPPAGALLLLQEATPSEAPSSAILVGGGFHSGRFLQVVGEDYYAGCDGDIRVPTVAPRDQLAADVRLGFERRASSGRQFTVLGRFLFGEDALDRVGEGPVSRPPVSHVATRAGGISLASETPGGMWRLGVMSGSLSNQGNQASAIVPSAAFRLTLSPRWFAHGQVAPSQYFPSLGEFSYAGLGVSRGPGKTRAAIGLGEGGHFELMMPFGNSAMELAYRTLPSNAKSEGASLFTLGITKRIAIRP